MNSNSYSNPCVYLSVFIIILALAIGVASAQQRGRPSSQPATASQNTKDDAGRRRTQAINLLIETADRARLFNDLVYRARIQTLAADALWSFDEAHARQIFLRAWEAAGAADRAEERAAEEEAGIFSNSAETTLTAEREKVLSRAAALDPKLADKFLREMIEERDRASEGSKSNKATRRTPWRELSPSGARRLALAYQLLNEGNYIRAAQVAEPLINEGVSGELVEFLLRFRFRLSSPDANDALGWDGSVVFIPSTIYRRLVEKTAADPYADANDVLLLSSFLVSPALLMAVDEKGSLQFRSLPSAPIKINPPESAAFRPFYNLAVNVLLQRSTSSQRATNSVQDGIARYVAMGRLLPFFEQAGPEYVQFVPAMRSQLATLSSEMEENRRDALDAQFELTSLNPKNARDSLAPQLEELTRVNDKQERDRISLSVVRKAARERLWDRAQRTAYGIEDTNLRRAALSFIVVYQIADISRAYKDDKEDDFESVARFVRRADAPPFASAWGLAQAAIIAARRKDREQVRALLSEAESYAARADKNSRQRIAAYIVLTDAAAKLSETRAWDYLSELVRTVNSTDDYMGDEISLGTSAESGGDQEAQEELNIEADDFRLDRIFATMARIDFDKTQAQAQALTGEIPRSYARIAAARAALEKK